MAPESHRPIESKLLEDARAFYRPHIAQRADQAATFFENRGQVDQAVSEWRTAEFLKSEEIDSKVCQALLKSVNATDQDRLAAQLQWAKRYAISLPDDDTIRFRPYDGRRKISLGYVCSFWNSSTIRGQAIPFISEHNRIKFAVIGYSLYECPHDITRHFDEFVVICDMTHEAFAKRVREDQVDVLVELTGFSLNQRFAAMGARAAPVQISYLNHPGTSGVANVDYVLADPIAAPEHLDRNYTEEILRLPGCFFNFNFDWDKFPDAGPAPMLKNGFVTFGCFSSPSKINDAQIWMWTKLLHAVPESRLFLRNMGLAEQWNRDFMLRRFRQWGIEPERLRIEKGGNRHSILKDYAHIDISLDTWPYNGGNTIAESLWQGVPVITLKGDSFGARYGASLLTASGCKDLVAESVDEMIRVAQELNRDPSRVDYLRGSLRRMMMEHGFSDVKAFTAKLETVFEATVRKALPSRQAVS